MDDAGGEVVFDRSLVRRQLARGYLHLRGLPRTVLADQSDDLARREIEGNVIDGDVCAEALGDVREAHLDSV
jgi:hypothetical protein